MRTLVLVHRWVGLVLAAYVFLVGVSGGLLLAKKPYYRAAFPLLERSIDSEQVRGHADVLASIGARYGWESVELLKFPLPGMNAFQLWLTDGTQALVDPRSGQTMGRWSWHERPSSLLFELHAHLFAGSTGELLGGVMGLLTAALLVGTGPILWWRRRRKFRLRNVLPRELSSREGLRWHAAAGTLLTAPLLLFALTGAGMVFYGPVWNALSGSLDQRPPERPDATVEPREEAPRSWDEILDVVAATFPEGRLVYFYPGTADNAVLTFRKRLPDEWHPNGRSYVLVDPWRGEVVQAIDATEQGLGTRITERIYPLHAATIGGLGYQLLAAASGFVLAGLALTGVWSYLGRGVRRRRRSR